MRLLLFQFTVRRLMVAVPVLAALLWAGLEGVGLGKRARHYRELALSYSNMLRLAEEDAAGKEERITRWANRPEDPRHERWTKELWRSREQAAYYSAMANKYHRLASRPWEPLTPDPPNVAGPPTPRPPGPE
jgi:hypothetical protein